MSGDKSCASLVDLIDEAGMNRRRQVRECKRCAWAAHQTGAHKTMDCFMWIRKEKATPLLPKPKEYQMMKVGAYDLQEEEQDVYTDESEEHSDELRDSTEYEEEVNSKGLRNSAERTEVVTSE